jgi:integrase-like protein
MDVACLVVKPDTVLDWEKRRFKRYWTKKSLSDKAVGRPPIPLEHIEFIRKISSDHPTYGEDRIAGILKKNFGVDHSPSTIRKYMVKNRGDKPGSQNWGTFLNNQAEAIYSCDFLVEFTMTFKMLYIFVILHLASRRVIHFGVTGSPTLAWVKQQIREATAWGECPKFWIHDNDGIFGQHRVTVKTEATGKKKTYRSSLDYWLYNSLGIRGLPTPYEAPNANAYCERLNRTIRNECLDHMIIWHERQLKSVLREYFEWYNRARFHQGIDGIPDPYAELKGPKPGKGKLVAIPVLNGLHHDYRLAA